MGTRKLLRLVNELPEKVRDRELSPTPIREIQETSEFCRKCLALLDRNDPVPEILSVESDVLGVYEISPHHSRTRYPPPNDGSPRGDKEPNPARIRLFWAVIGVVAACRSWSVEDLTIVVLTHELAHAYTQLGADLDGRRWPPKAFSEADVSLKEGLAQHIHKTSPRAAA